ncbi:MAG: hypothetical protein D6826_03000 [Alphaproteobacteria bacterium]|nr:MAG: hypothetical protein D6826_03000 [Alphaproteobacteria bacterium]
MSRNRRGNDTRRPPALAPEDRALWRHVIRDAKPLRRRARHSFTPASEAPASEVRPPEAAPKPATPVLSSPSTVRRPPPPPPPPQAGPPPSERRHGSVVGVDRRTATRLRRGQLPVEAILDLHGHTQAAAHRALTVFLARAQAAGKRCVLVVTGKGLAKDSGGILRTQVPRWLNEAPNRDRVLAFDYARPHHGGMGALYVLLRRPRG